MASQRAARNLTQSALIPSALSGSSSAISDLAHATGWTILDYDTNATAQDIRVICTGDNYTCNHVYLNGAIDTIVRLPSRKMPFARISSEYEQEMPPVRGFSLDTEFAQIDASRLSQLIQSLGFLILTYTVVMVIHLSGETFDYNTGLLNGELVFDIPFVTEVVDCQVPNSVDTFLSGVSVKTTSSSQATDSLNVNASDTMIPQFELTSLVMEVYGNLTMQGTFDMWVVGMINFETGRVLIYSHDIPGFQILPGQVPGCYAEPPAFWGGAGCSHGRRAVTSVEFTYTVDNALFLLEKWAVAAIPNEDDQGAVLAYLTPTIALGIETSTASTNITYTVDTSSETDLSFAASSTSAFNGCSAVKTGFQISAAADANFYDIYTAGTTVTLVNKDWGIFSECWGGTKRERTEKMRRAPPSIAKRDILCYGDGTAMDLVTNKTYTVSF
ncbi:hypothetical protein NM688_g1258 [Phlebia brevispora]|uniref:Uncharacterized protein n=1 Tax=Phlebia brevispora TaxID=194682 RepID=A0ACC1TBP9_9APHY|nr:hypothetical protein NM688_g1258 [Phlebia brevispora]